mmetsp:Transcript_8250/g.15625  ORF Transcript_8250/g.15625 Transcript_8250/m.15625 type:complete len:201 (+) Transcript_8250:1434-2036(+)
MGLKTCSEVGADSCREWPSPSPRARRVLRFSSAPLLASKRAPSSSRPAPDSGNRVIPSSTSASASRTLRFLENLCVLGLGLGLGLGVCMGSGTLGMEVVRGRRRRAWRAARPPPELKLALLSATRKSLLAGLEVRWEPQQEHAPVAAGWRWCSSFKGCGLFASVPALRGVPGAWWRWLACATSVCTSLCMRSSSARNSPL